MHAQIAECKEDIEQLTARCESAEKIIRGFKEAADLRVRDSEDECKRLRGQVRWVEYCGAEERRLWRASLEIRSLILSM